MLKARRLGRELYVGVHSDEDILHHKGPVVMRLAERMAAVDACKWSSRAIADAPYVTLPLVKSEYGCDYVVHGDDITTDADGKDCYQAVKDQGMFVVVERTANISTTDLVGRMLLMTRSHHFSSMTLLDWQAGALLSPENIEKLAMYASDATGHHASLGVYLYIDGATSLEVVVSPSQSKQAQYARMNVYVDGGFDLFHPGHIGVLKAIKKQALDDGAMVVVGIHDDSTINTHKGLNYPIMNLLERALCVLQCRYVDAVILATPYSPTKEFLSQWVGPISAVYHGPTPITGKDAYSGFRKDGLFREIGHHDFDEINTDRIVDRVLQNKAAYEERQRRKGWKSETELQMQIKALEDRSLQCGP